MKDYVDVKPRQQQRGETWLESIAAGIAAIVSLGMFAAVLLMLGV